MSLPLVDQKLGSHSEPTSSSHKFMLKGRQSGGMHKSHSWVFRAESYDTMMAWFSDIKNLTEKTGIERETFIRRTHARSVSGNSHRSGSISEGSALDEDEADQVPYSAAASQAEPSTEKLPQRPQPGGRFPSLLSINRDSQVAAAPSSPSEDSGDRDAIAGAGAMPGSGMPFRDSGHQEKVGNDGAMVGAVLTDTYSPDTPKHSAFPNQGGEEHSRAPVQSDGVSSDGVGSPASAQNTNSVQRHDSTYGDWMAPTTAGGGAGAPGTQAYVNQPISKDKEQDEQAGLHAVQESTPSAVPNPATTNIPSDAAQTSNAPTTDAAPLTETGDAGNKKDPASPLRGLADADTSDSRTMSMASSQMQMPGGYPPSRVNTQMQ